VDREWKARVLTVLGDLRCAAAIASGAMDPLEDLADLGWICPKMGNQDRASGNAAKDLPGVVARSVLIVPAHRGRR
jgi:hypothetical protein